MRTRQPDIPPVPHMKWGTVTNSGVVDPGSADWTMVRTGVGIYVITFTKPFSSIPIVVLTPYFGTGNIIANIQARSTSSFTAIITQYNGAAIDSSLVFVAVGIIK